MQPKPGDQQVLTPRVSNILGTLIEAKAKKQRIISVCPHYTTQRVTFGDGAHFDSPASLAGYFVIVEETYESVAMETARLAAEGGH